MTRRISLKQRLLLLVLGVITLVWLSATAFTYQEAREEFDEMLDAHLAQAASLLSAQSAHELEEIDTEHAPLMHKYASRVAFQIWENGRHLRLHSANAPQKHITRKERGFSDVTFDGERWRAFSAWDESGEFLIQVAERTDAREEIEEEIIEGLLRPLLIALPLLALLLWVAVARGLHPLGKLARELERREPDNLAALDTSSAPREVLPLIERLNRLFARIETSMQKERRFTADAAHELRTPVAAIKAQAQVARSASGEAERIHALDNAILGCDRAAHLIDQLLTLARVDTLDRGVTEPCRLRDIAAEIIGTLAPAALEKGVQLELLEDGGNAPGIRGNPELLRVLLRNLLDNAIRHTPPGTSVQVSVTHDTGTTCLSVSDNGPGIPEQERVKVLERFYRPLGTPASGSGLGLSIVKRVAEVHDADLRIQPAGAGRGVRVTVNFSA
jgi:two-component system sensor histidine kinase QseC